MVAAFLVRDGTFVTTDGSAAVLAEAGGPDAIHRVTSRFYARLFVDKDLSNFVADPEEPHAERLGNWMVEKLGGAGTPWTLERAERAKCPVTRILGNGEPQLVHDRTSAHRAAWFSPRRPAEEMGRRFKLPECRVWMRLMFWSAREEGLLDKAPSFAQFFVQFIAHFVRVYEASAPGFAAESLAWSANPANTQAYLDADNKMQL